MRISYKEFHAQLTGARLCDGHRWVKLNQEAALWQLFAFADDGAYYLSPKERRLFSEIDSLKREIYELDWGAKYKNNPGYFEPEEGWVIQ